MCALRPNLRHLRPLVILVTIESEKGVVIVEKILQEMYFRLIEDGVIGVKKALRGE